MEAEAGETQRIDVTVSYVIILYSSSFLFTFFLIFGLFQFPSSNRGSGGAASNRGSGGAVFSIPATAPANTPVKSKREQDDDTSRSAAGQAAPSGGGF